MITSAANPQIKEVRRLLHERKERERTGTYVIEGLRITGEAIQLDAPIELIIIAPELLVSDFGLQMVAAARSAGRPVLEVSSDVFKSLSVKEGPQGVAAVLRQSWVELEQVRLAPGDLWVALDSVADPGNLGTILRTVDAVGGTGVILLDHSTDPYDPTALRASMGAVFSLRLVRSSFDRFARWKTGHRYALVGTSGAAAQDFHTACYSDPLILMMGSERQGLPESHLALCDQVIAIPMAGRSDSLNLAVATGVTLYEIYNHRRDQKGRG